MKVLFAPWRNEYTESEARTKNDGITKDECVFCHQLRENNDEKYYILKRYSHCYVVLNKYPYNAGHILILPLKHVGSLNELSPETRAEIMELTNVCTQAVQDALKCDGVNIGMNLGKAAGAGIPSHLHMHVLPRWTGDTNFMPTLGNTKVISFNLDEIYQKLRPYFSGDK